MIFIDRLKLASQFIANEIENMQSSIKPDEFSILI